MGRGGARRGAGRKAGGANKKTAEIANQAAALGITPLEVMLANMRWFWARGDRLAAQSAACDAAPFMHAKLVATQVTVRRPDEMSDDELLASISVAETESERIAEAARASVPDGAGETRH
jgi:hypothetical protein